MTEALESREDRSAPSMGCERVAERVRRDARGDGSFSQPLQQNASHAPVRQAGAAQVQEDGFGVGAQVRSGSDVSIHARSASRPCDRTARSALVPLPEHADQAAKDRRPRIQRDQFSDTQTGGVKEFQQRPVTDPGGVVPAIPSSKANASSTVRFLGSSLGRFGVGMPSAGFESIVPTRTAWRRNDLTAESLRAIDVFEMP